jgi:hypothetical protein
LADGITAMPGTPETAVAGVPISNAVFATFTVTDPTVAPGEDWRALINFGDGHTDGPVIPIQKGDVFELVDGHTYRALGTYTVTVMIALPGSMMPNDNTVITRVTVSSPSGTPTPTPTASPTPSPLAATGLKLVARKDRQFHARVAILSQANAHPGDLNALIDWGDLSPPTTGQIHPLGRGRFSVIGAHRYVQPGIYGLVIAVRDAPGSDVIVKSQVRVIA